jgi:hypothetical protein
VQTHFWTDPDVRTLHPDAKFLWLYLITNPHTHVSGIYYLATPTMAAETGLQECLIDTLLPTLSGIAVDPPRSLVWVKNMLKHQAKGEKAFKAAAAQLKTLHNTFLIKDFLTVYPCVVPYFSIGYPYPIEGSSSVGPLKEEMTSKEKEDSPLPLTVEEIRTRWNQLPGVRLCDEIQEGMLDRINKLRKCHDPSWWEKLFAKVAGSPFLTGQVPPREGKQRSFRASLGWVTGKVILGRVLAGEYSDEQGMGQTCQTRVKSGLRLVPCGAPATLMIGTRPVCAQHAKETVHAGKRTEPAPA